MDDASLEGLLFYGHILVYILLRIHQVVAEAILFPKFGVLRRRRALGSWCQGLRFRSVLLAVISVNALRIVLAPNQEARTSVPYQDFERAGAWACCLNLMARRVAEATTTICTGATPDRHIRLNPQHRHASPASYPVLPACHAV